MSAATTIDAILDRMVEGEAEDHMCQILLWKSRNELFPLMEKDWDELESLVGIETSQEVWVELYDESALS